MFPPRPSLPGAMTINTILSGVDTYDGWHGHAHGRPEFETKTLAVAVARLLRCSGRRVPSRAGHDFRRRGIPQVVR